MAHQHLQAGPSTRRRSTSDPLAAALLPPPDESPEQRERRLRAEEEAKKRSDHIDRILREGEKERRRKKVIKILLLGQSESGKSTTLKRELILAAFPFARLSGQRWSGHKYCNSSPPLLQYFIDRPSYTAILKSAEDTRKWTTPHRISLTVNIITIYHLHEYTCLRIWIPRIFLRVECGCVNSLSQGHKSGDEGLARFCARSLRSVRVNRKFLQAREL